MKEFKSKTQAGKLKVRGLFKTSLFAYNMGIATNFGGIYRKVSKKRHKGGFFFKLEGFFSENIVKKNK